LPAYARVLVAEDNKVNQLIIKSHLKVAHVCEHHHRLVRFAHEWNLHLACVSLLLLLLCMCMCVYVQKMGCTRFDIANNGAEAVKMCTTKAYDLILMDW
jgi:CheY-like chemotaxis protein